MLTSDMGTFVFRRLKDIFAVFGLIGANDRCIAISNIGRKHWRYGKRDGSSRACNDKLTATSKAMLERRLQEIAEAEKCEVLSRDRRRTSRPYLAARVRLRNAGLMVATNCADYVYKECTYSCI